MEMMIAKYIQAYLEHLHRNGNIHYRMNQETQNADP